MFSIGFELEKITERKIKTLPLNIWIQLKKKLKHIFLAEMSLIVTLKDHSKGTAYQKYQKIGTNNTWNTLHNRSITRRLPK